MTDGADTDPDANAIHEVVRAYRSSRAFAESVTRSSRFAADLEFLIRAVPSMSVSTRRALELTAREVQFAALLGRLGIYRAAFGALRLALESATWGIFLSTDEIAARQWLSSVADLKWSSCVYGPRGVLTGEFADVFFPGLAEGTVSFQAKARDLYRELSGFVHGEARTHVHSAVVGFDHDASARLSDYIGVVREIVFFVYVVRYLGDMSTLDDHSRFALSEVLGHIEPIRARLEAMQRS